MGSSSTMPPHHGKHGAMVPCNVRFAYVPQGSNTITALVEWGKPHHALVSAVYALVSEGVPTALPSIDALHLGSRIQELLNAGQLIPLNRALSAADFVGLYRVNDFVTHRRFQVWHDTRGSQSQMRMVPNAVYGLYPNGRPSELQTQPHLITFTPGDLAVCARQPGVVLINKNDGPYSIDELADNGATLILESAHPW